MNLYTPNIGQIETPVVFDISSADLSGGLLIRSPNWLGDAIMSLPGVYRLRALLPAEVRVNIVCPSKLKSLWESVPWIDKVVSFIGKRFDGVCRDELRALDPGASILLPNSFGSAWDFRRLGLRHVVGRSGRGRTLLIQHRLPGWNRVPGQDQFHESRNYLEIAGACGAATDSWAYPALEPKLSAAELESIQTVLELENLLIVAPGAAYGPAKQWPEESFQEVCRWWSEEIGNVVVVGAQAEKEVADRIAASGERVSSLAGATNLKQLSYLIAKARCVISNDSGAMHLSAALGKKGVAIFGSTDATATGPIGGEWEILHRDLPCSPCLRRTCYRKDSPYECLRTVEPAAAIGSLKALISSEP